MSLPISSSSSRNRLTVVMLAAVLVAGSCAIDERDLSETPALSAAGRASSSGSAGAPELAQAGQPVADMGSGSSAGFGGVSSGAGEPNVAGSPNGGLDSRGGSTAGDAGSGGSPTAAGPCGDIDQNGVDDCSETLVANARFDSDLSHWDAEQLETQSWDARNAGPEPNSGALLVSNTAPVATGLGSYMAGAHQCVQVTADVGYEVAARVLIPGGQGGGVAGVNLQFFDTDGCQGDFLGAETVGTTADVDAWRVVLAEVKAPSAARSMWLRLVASKPFPEPQLDALFDDVLVRLQ
jgi:hypothetical protein